LWDETESKWWFSALDIIGILNDEDDYTKTRKVCHGSVRRFPKRGKCATEA